MSDTVQKRVEFVFAGNDQALKKAAESADGVLKGLDAKVQASFKNVNKSFSLEALAKSGLVISAAINAIDVASEALAGDIQTAAELLKKLPFGIGQMTQAMERLLGRFSGITEEMADLNREQQLNNALIEAGNKALQARREYIADSAKRIEASQMATRLASLPKPQAEREKEIAQFKADKEAIESRMNAAVDKINASHAEALQKASKATVSNKTIQAWIQDYRDRRGTTRAYRLGLSGQAYDDETMRATEWQTVEAMLNNSLRERLAGNVERRREKAAADVRGQMSAELDTREQAYRNKLRQLDKEN